jgi:hypothetical protein
VKTQLLFSTMIAVCAFSSGAFAWGGPVSTKPIVDFMKSIEGDYDLEGSITARDSGFQMQTLDCSQISIGAHSLADPGDSADRRVNAFVSKRFTDVRIVAGIGYYDAKVKIHELTPTTLHIEDFSSFEGSSNMFGASFAPYVNRTELIVKKDALGKLESITLKFGRSSEPSIFNVFGSSDWQAEETAECQVKASYSK